MYVCICNNVTESDIEDAVRAGARTLECLAESLAVSTCCGQCACFADECLQVALALVERPSSIGHFHRGSDHLPAAGDRAAV